MNKYTQEPIPNPIEAASTVIDMLVNFNEKKFYTKYTPQPITTNEIEYIYKLKNHIKPGAKVLTVAASGEQPLFCKLYGAEHVVTFDISYNAYLLTSLKMAALQAFEKTEDYTQFINNLSHYSKPGELMDTPKLNCVMPYLSNMQKKHICFTDEIGTPIFLQDISCDFYTIPQSQYTYLRQSVKLPLPFIWSNITELDKKLGDDSFDIIYYSNILQFLEPYKIKPVLEDIKKHINHGGKLFLLSQINHISPIIDAIEDVFEYTPGWNIAFLPSQDFGSFQQIIIQRNQQQSR